MIYDYRQTPRAAKGFHVHLGKEHTYFFEWANFETAPKHPANDAPKFPSWSRFLTAMGGDTLLETISTDDTFMTYGGALILDHYRDSFKWGAVRSLQSPETLPLLQALHQRGIVCRDTPVYWGNWASVNGILAGTIGSLLNQQEITVYHGSSSERWARIQRRGALVPATPKDRVWPRDRKFKSIAIGMTTCPHRARYFAEHTARHDRKQAGAKQKSAVQPVILAMTLSPSDILVADHDFLEYEPVPEKSPENSLRLFGQAGIQGDIPVNRVRVFETQEVAL